MKQPMNQMKSMMPNGRHKDMVLMVLVASKYNTIKTLGGSPFMDDFLENATNETFTDHSIFQLDIMANVSMMDSKFPLQQWQML